MKLALGIALLAILLPCMTLARPVSYPGGLTLMQRNDVERNSLHVHYSPTAKYSIGYKAEYWRDQQWQFHGLQFNYLAKRWNWPAAQTNIYIKSAAGLMYQHSPKENKNAEAAGFVGLALDWENRRFFSSYQNSLYNAGEIGEFFMQQVRLGIAPYIGNYGDLHTWLMLQLDHNSERENEVIATPLLRFFKDEYLAEIGVNEDGDTLLNFIIRF